MGSLRDDPQPGKAVGFAYRCVIVSDASQSVLHCEGDALETEIHSSVAAQEAHKPIALHASRKLGLIKRISLADSESYTLDIPAYGDINDDQALCRLRSGVSSAPTNSEPNLLLSAGMPTHQEASVAAE
jgi:hypothetical protein